MYTMLHALRMFFVVGVNLSLLMGTYSGHSSLIVELRMQFAVYVDPGNPLIPR